MSQRSSAFWKWRRLADWGDHPVLLEDRPSRCRTKRSSPRWAGRQWRKTASARDVRRQSLVHLERPRTRLRGRRSASCSCPMLAQTSVYTTSALISAFFGSWSTTRGMLGNFLWYADRKSSGNRCWPGGDARERTASPAGPKPGPASGPRCCCPPTKTRFTPSSRPRLSLIVSMSAIAWHGCATSERALTTGTVANRASSSTVLAHREGAGRPARTRRTG